MTLEEILKDMERRYVNPRAETLNGVPVRTSIHIPVDAPRMKLHPDLLLSDSVRKSTDDWLEEFFGRQPVVLQVQGIGLVMNPATLTKLKEKLIA